MSIAWPLLEPSDRALAPDGWREARLADLANLANGYPFDSATFGSSGALPLVRIRDLGDGALQTWVPDPVPPSAVLRDDDIVIGMDGDFNVAWWSKGQAALNQRLCRLRARLGVSQRFLYYALPRVLGVINDLTYFTTVKHLASGDLLAEKLFLPPLEEQQRIADYLDAETARIDQLIAEQQHLATLTEEHLEATIDQVIWGNATAVIPLGQVTPPDRPIMYGIVLPGPNVEEGVLIVKGGDVRPDRLRAGSLCRTTPEIEARYARARLQEGDVVYAIRGSIGDAAVVPPEVAGANITQDVARIAPGPAVGSRWLLYAVTSRGFFAQMDAEARGATIRGINIWSLKRGRVPWIDRTEQDRQAASLDEQAVETDAIRAELALQISLLHEHRQALITHAVTQGIDGLPGVA